MPSALPRDRAWQVASRSAAQTAVLEKILQAAALPGALVSFDLDSTLFDNRPRQLAILAEFAQSKGLTGVEKLQPERIDGWRTAEEIAALGGAAGREQELMAEFKAFWKGRFFTSEVCRHDLPLPGAPEYVLSVAGSGARVVYLTGRHEDMREGTVKSLSAARFPDAHLLMKPTFQMNDTEWKEVAVTRMREMGTVVAAFDNETTHVNRLRSAFPAATVVWIRTDGSPDAEPLAPDIHAIDGFLR
jgi:predicted secreted acid phosphatase